jgi:hypothetical protein
MTQQVTDIQSTINQKYRNSPFLPSRSFLTQSAGAGAGGGMGGERAGRATSAASRDES